MTRSDRQDPETRSRPERTHGKARQTLHSVRFSDLEWNLIEYTAARYGLPAAEVVRSGALAFAENRLSAHPAASLSAGHVALIEATYCAVHLLSALATGQMRHQVIDHLADAAHKAMLETMKQEPVRVVPDRSQSPARRKRDNEARHVPGRSHKLIRL